ncbi:diphthine-ammonia ligase [Acrasis kona]|uniref:Diphthine--ammonia ligase n=1 Tax=Acrasis kona TaxID=1008807 RepID=A0AAW2ZB63_9EUKA
MKVVALVSGGKDSCYNMMKCVEHGHTIECIANLAPPDESIQELDSWTFQTVGHNVIEAISHCLEVPLFRGELHAVSSQKTLEYDENVKGEEGAHKDEVEELFELLSRVKTTMPDIEGVSCGAILSDYQRYRVENVCSRLGLISLCYLWRRDQSDLLSEMISSGIHAVLIKTASLGLSPKKHCGKSLAQLHPILEKLKLTCDLNVCGEGGEYETLTLDCPLFKKSIIIDESEIVCLDQDMYAPVGHLHIKKYHLEDKEQPPHQSRSNSFKISTFIREPQSDIDVNHLSKHILCNVSRTIGSGQLDYFFVNASVSQEIDYDAGIQTSVMFQVILNLLKTKIESDQPMQFCLQNTVVVKNMNDFSRINNSYSKFYHINPPSRVCIECDRIVGSLQLNCLFAVPNPSFQHSFKKVMHVQSVSEWAPACIGPYSQAVVVQNIIYCAGQIALVPQSMTLVPIRDDLMEGVVSQMRQCIKNVHQTLTALSSCIHNVTRCDVYVDQDQVHGPHRNLLEGVVITIWSEYLEEISQDTNVEKNRVLNDLKFDFFRVVFVSKLPRSSSVEYHVTAVDKNIQSVNYTPIKTEIHSDQVRIVRRHVVTSNDESSLHTKSLDIYGVCDEEFEVSQFLRSVKDCVSCRIFVTQQGEKLCDKVMEYLNSNKVLVSKVPVTRIAPFNGLDQQMCLMSLDFE